MALDDTVTTTIVIDGSPTSRWDPGEAFVAMAVGPHDDVELIDVDSARMRSTVEVIDSGSIGPESIGLPLNPMGEDVPSPVPMRLPEPTDPRPDPRQEKCRRTWEAHRDDLPTAVRDALAQKMYPLAVGLAIHGGTRDARALADMVFLNEYGPRRGYCALTSAEQMYVMLWRDIMATIVLPRLALPSPPLAQAGGIVCVGRNERRLVAPAPDDPRVDVTGRYEQHTGGAVPAYTFRINQAGTHVEAALTSVILPMGAVRERVVYRFHGDVQSDGSFLLFNRTKPDWRVTLRRDPQTGSVSLDSAGTVDGLDLVTATSTLMESTLDHLPTGSTLVRRQEWFPLTRVQVRHLAEQLSPAIIEPYLRAYFDTPAGDLTYQMAAMRKAARPLDDHLNAVFNDAHSGVHYVDRPLGTLYARTLLSEGRWKHVLTRSHLDWIQILLDSATQGGHQDEFQGIQTHLGLRPTMRSSVSTPQHVYRVTLRLTGGGLFLSGYTGTIAIEKTSAPAWPTSAAWPNGRATFGIRLGGLDSKAAIGVGSEIVGTATSAWAWQPPDFPGTVSMVRGGVGAAGLSAEAGFLHINGSGVYPPMAVLFSDSGFDPAEPTDES